MPILGTIYNPSVGTRGIIGSGNGYAQISLSPGIYILSLSFPLNFSSGTYAASYASVTLISGTATLPASSMYFPGATAQVSSNMFIISGTFFANVTVTSLIRANVYFAGAGNVSQGTGTFFQAIRIA